MSDIPEEVMRAARNVAREAVERPYNVKSTERAASIIARALMAERKRALEEAAVTCENIYSPDGHASHDWPTPEECAAAIRKLGED